MIKRCQYCGQFFVPDARTVKTQKACGRVECKEARKKEAQKSWRQGNVLYRKNHYRDYVVPWRQRNKEADPPLPSLEVKAVEKIKDGMPEKIKEEIPAKVIKDKMSPPMVKDGIPPSKPLIELVLLIPGDVVGMIKDEIRLRKVDTHRFSAYG